MAKAVAAKATISVIRQNKADEKCRTNSGNFVTVTATNRCHSSDRLFLYLYTCPLHPRFCSYLRFAFIASPFQSLALSIHMQSPCRFKKRNNIIVMLSPAYTLSAALRLPATSSAFERRNKFFVNSAA